MQIVPLLKQAGMSTAQFAEMCGVTRGMVYRWERGDNPHPLRRPRVDKLIAAITTAIEAGELPVKTDKEAKLRETRGAILANLKKGT